MKAFIVGLGWFGLPLAKKLKRSGIEVEGSVSSTEKAQEISKEVKARAIKLPQSRIEIPKVDVIVYTIPPRGNQTLAEESIKAVIKAAEQNQISKAIYISSTSVYKAGISTWQTEEDATYLHSKHSGVVLKSLEDIWLNSSIATTILRSGGLYGSTRNPGNFFRSGFVPNPENTVNMTHLNELILATQLVIHRNAFGEVFTVLSENKEKRIDFYRKYNPKLKYGLSTQFSEKFIDLRKWKEFKIGDK